MYASVDFNFNDTSGDTLQLDEPSDTGSDFAGIITGSMAGNAIVLPNVGFDVGGIQTTGTYDAASQTYVVTIGDPVSLTFNVAGLTGASNLKVAQHGAGIELVMCFAAGTAIRTPAGDVAVETLREGDQVCLARADDLLPVRWVGRRRIDCRRHPRPEAVWPVRIRAGAFADTSPTRDLWLSPDHAVFCDGVLIPVRYLIDGNAIVQEQVDSVTYYHIELDRHDIVLAEGLPTETYLDSGDRARFENAGLPVTLHPGLMPDAAAVSLAWEAKGCAPLVVTGPAVAKVRARLRRRAAAMVQDAAA